MKRLMVLLILISMTGVPNVLAQRISGTGFGKTLEEARHEALAELSQMIRVEVKSEFSRVQTQKNTELDELKTKIIQLKSDLPILGARFSALTSKEGFMVDAVLDDTADTLYVAEVKKITTLITRNLAALDQTPSRASRVTLFQSILTQIEQYYKLRIVAQFLKCPNLPDCPVTSEDIRIRLAALEEKADTLLFGLNLLARNFKDPRVYIYPPTAEQSSEVTQFGAAVKDHLATLIPTVARPDQAEHVITGSYRLLDTGIELTCHLIDKDNNTVKTAMVFFLPSAYADYTVKPLSLDFEKLIEAGHVVSGDFRVDIKSEKGKQDLLYTRGDTMKLLVKMNKPGYFYLVSHNLKETASYSYIIHFTDEPDNRRFVYYVGGEAVNKWLELGEFEVVPPFGVETLQMVASTEDLIDRVPATYRDPATGLYTIGAPRGTSPAPPLASAPAQALHATRGLMLQKKRASAEATLMFTAMEKKQGP